MPSSDRRFLAACRQLLEGKLTQGLQHDEAWLTVRTCLLAQQTLVQKRGDTLERIALRFTPSARDGRRRLEGEATGEDREATEEHLLLGREQVVTPGDGVPHRALPFRDITSAAGQQRQPLLEPAKECGWRQHLDPRRGEFDREGQAVHAPQIAATAMAFSAVRAKSGCTAAARSTKSRTAGRGNVLERRCRSGLTRPSGGDRKLVLTGHGGSRLVARIVTPGHASVGRPRRRGLEDLLAVVQDEQEPLAAQDRLSLSMSGSPAASRTASAVGMAGPPGPDR